MILGNIINFFILFPFPRRVTGQPHIFLDQIQKQALQAFRKKIKKNIYTTIENKCLCGADTDIDIVKEDKFGLPFDFKLCTRCSLIRTGTILDEKSLMNFYSGEFSLLHRGDIKIDDFFSKQLIRGGWIYDLLDKKINIDNDILNVLEIGCASGGNLYPYYKKGKNISGFDYDQKFTSFARDKGMNVLCGDYYNKIEENSQDIVLLVHVLEHFTDPVKEMVKIISKVKYSGYLYIEVPGVMDMSDSLFSPLKYFQNDHIFHFNETYLKSFFVVLGLKIIHSDEKCRFILRKPNELCMPTDYSFNFDLKKVVDSIKLVLKKKYFLNDLMKLIYVRMMIVKLLEKFRLKKLIKRVVNGVD